MPGKTICPSARKAVGIKIKRYLNHLRKNEITNHSFTQELDIPGLGIRVCLNEINILDFYFSAANYPFLRFLLAAPNIIKTI